MPVTSEKRGFVPLNATTGKEMRLAMQSLWVTGRVLPAGARLRVRHMFRSDEKKLQEVIYAFALPRDATLRRFQVTGDGFSVHSELRPAEEAVQAYERGIEDGHLSTLARLYGDGLVNLTIGNIRPGETVTVDVEVLAGIEPHDSGIRFRFPFTLAPGYHSKARAAEVETDVGEMELPEDDFGDLILPRFVADATSLHHVGFDLSIRMPQSIAEMGSPSHAVRVELKDPCNGRVRLAREKALPDHDLVLDVRTREPLSGVLAGIGRDGKGRFVAMVPSKHFGEVSEEARRVVMVLDRSGSMQGVPMVQARKAFEACLGALSEQDLFGIVAFDSEVEVFRPSLAPGTMDNRTEAAQFLEQIETRGGTELFAGIEQAAKLLDNAPGDLLVITDGQVLGTESIFQQARSLGIRIHCLGIGGASQDRFLSLLARETGGVSRFVTPGERVDLPAVDLFASMGRPVATRLEVRVDGIGAAEVAPVPPSTLFSSAPLVVFGETAGAAEGNVVIEWESRQTRQQLILPLVIQQDQAGETLRLLHGARLITDLEARLIHGDQHRAADKRQYQRVTDRLRSMSEAFGLASRSMALVAVVERKDDRPGALPETSVVPVGMPKDTLFSGYFGDRSTARYRVAHPQRALNLPLSLQAGVNYCMAIPGNSSAPKEVQPEDILLNVASRLEPDGGMPGGDDEERALASAIALLAFLSAGHTLETGAFRSHVVRLVRFLATAAFVSLADNHRAALQEIVAVAREKKTLPGEWHVHAEAIVARQTIPKERLWKLLDAVPAAGRAKMK